MSVKQSLVDNTKEILDSLPTQELKDEFTSSLETMEEPQAPSTEELVAEAQGVEHITEDMREAVKADVEKDNSVTPMSAEEEESATAENLKLVPTDENDGEPIEIDVDALEEQPMEILPVEGELPEEVEPIKE